MIGFFLSAKTTSCGGCKVGRNTVMDIRKYFGGVPKTSSQNAASNQKTTSSDSRQRKRKAEKNDSKDDADFKPSASRKKRVTVILDSSDEEDPIPRNVKAKANQKSASTPVRQSVPPKHKVSSSEKRKLTSKSSIQSESSLKPVTLNDFFGNSPVKRSSRTDCAKQLVKPNGRAAAANDSIDEELHDDEDFMRTLQQLDAQPSDNETIKPVVEPGRTSRKSARLSPSKSERTSPKKSERTPPKESERTPPKESERTPPKKSAKTSLTKSATEDSLDSAMEIEDAPSQPLTFKKDSTCSSSSKNKNSGGINEDFTGCIEIESGSDMSQPDKTRSMLSTPGSNKKLKRNRNSLDDSSLENDPKEHITPKMKKALSTPVSSEKHKGNSTNYLQYLNRSGPKALGSKEIPEGADGCFRGLTFVITGVLESLTRDDAADIVKKYGGKVTQSVSKNTSYIVIGEEAGPSKVEKAEKLKTKQLDEDGFLQLIVTLSAAKSGNSSTFSKMDTSPNKHATSGGSKKIGGEKEEKVCGASTSSFYHKKEQDSFNSVAASSKTSTYFPASQPASSKSSITTDVTDSLLWVDKYKPTSIKQIIGQQGDRSNVKKLLWWLKNWQKNSSSGQVKKKPNPMRWNANDDGSAFKAALLSGPPGVGKTTSATLVCQELGFSFVELNASDTRSKKSLKQEVQELLSNQSLVSQFAAGDTSFSKTITHCLIMDEVDGMAGNEDRGGVQELIALIKSTKVPIICMCNDRNHPKIRSLSNHCFDLRFQRPRMEQLKAAMMSICYKENLTIPPQALQEVIVGTNQDVRQVIHNLSMLSAKNRKLSTEEAHTEAQKSKKDIKIGPFDALKSVFSAEDHKTMSIHDKSDLFFYDYSIAPLFVQENYVNVRPRAAPNDKKKQLRLLSRTADSICDGDLVEKMIRSSGHWNLLPVEAVYASVIPGSIMEGTLTCQIAFPSWLGKNSKRGKFDRLLQELALHMRLRVSANKTDVNLEYASRICQAIVHPLQRLEMEGVGQAVQILESYDLLREDVNSLMEVTLWPGQEDPMTKVNSKVKAAFTRAYNNDGHLIPYAVSAGAKKGRQQTTSATEEGLDEVDEGDEEEEDDSINNDAMVKVKTQPKGRAAKKDDKNQKASSSRGRGRGRAR